MNETTKVSLEQLKANVSIWEEKDVSGGRMTRILSSGFAADICDSGADLSDREALRRALKLPANGTLRLVYGNEEIVIDAVGVEESMRPWDLSHGGRDVMRGAIAHDGKSHPITQVVIYELRGKGQEGITPLQALESIPVESLNDLLVSPIQVVKFLAAHHDYFYYQPGNYALFTSDGGPVMEGKSNLYLAEFHRPKYHFDPYSIWARVAKEYNEKLSGWPHRFLVRRPSWIKIMK